MRRVAAALRPLVSTAILLLLWGGPAPAHPLKVGFADVTVRRTDVEIALSVNLFELDLLLSLDRNLDARVDPEELESRRQEIVDYLDGRIKVFLGPAPLPLEVGPFRVGRSSDGRRIFEARLLFRADRPLDGPVRIQCEPLTDLGPDHQTIARISTDGRLEQFIFQKGVVYEAKRRGFLAYALQFLGLGVHHILVGYDHIAFLLGLLLAGGGLLNLVKVVTSFTLAHSVTLSLAALDVVVLPSRLVEAGIAVSVAYVALENLVSGSPGRRWLVSFFFGFVHGFGFANVLKEMALPRSGLASSLLFFNVGVEVGQVLIVALIFPLLWLLSRSALHRPVVVAASVVIFSVGALWFYQRAF